MHAGGPGNVRLAYRLLHEVGDANGILFVHAGRALRLYNLALVVDDLARLLHDLAAMSTTSFICTESLIQSKANPAKRTTTMRMDSE
jgi:hypothetical protein